MAANIIRKRLNVFLVLLILVAGFATTYDVRAAEKHPYISNQSKYDRRHEQVGTWYCSGVTTPPTGIQRPYYGMLQNQWTADGSWLLVRFEELQSPTGQPLIEDQYWGFDHATNKHTRTLYANDGSQAHVRSHGWQKDRLPWMGTFTVGETAYDYEEIIERISSKRYRWYGFITQGATTLISYDMTCARQ